MHKCIVFLCEAEKGNRIFKRRYRAIHPILYGQMFRKKPKDLLSTRYIKRRRMCKIPCEQVFVEIFDGKIEEMKTGNLKYI